MALWFTVQPCLLGRFLVLDTHAHSTKSGQSPDIGVMTCPVVVGASGSTAPVPIPPPQKFLPIVLKGDGDIFGAPDTAAHQPCVPVATDMGSAVANDTAFEADGGCSSIHWLSPQNDGPTCHQGGMRVRPHR